MDHYHTDSQANFASLSACHPDNHNPASIKPLSDHTPQESSHAAAISQVNPMSSNGTLTYNQPLSQSGTETPAATLAPNSYHYDGRGYCFTDDRGDPYTDARGNRCYYDESGTAYCYDETGNPYNPENQDTAYQDQHQDQTEYQTYQPRDEAPSQEILETKQPASSVADQIVPTLPITVDSSAPSVPVMDLAAPSETQTNYGKPTEAPVIEAETVEDVNVYQHSTSSGAGHESYSQEEYPWSADIATPEQVADDESLNQVSENLIDDLDDLVLQTRSSIEQSDRSSISQAQHVQQPNYMSDNSSYGRPATGPVSPHKLNSRQGTPAPDSYQALAGMSDTTMVECPQPQCNRRNKTIAKFCEECGHPLVGSSRTTTPSVPEKSAYSPPPSQPATMPLQSNYVPPQTQLATGAGQSNYVPPQTQSIYATSHPQPVGTTYSPTNVELSRFGAQPAASHGTINQAEEYRPVESRGAPGTIDTSQFGYQPQANSSSMHDPLGRAKGCSFVTFGFGGKMLCMFPQTAQSFGSGGYSAGSASNSSPGEIQVRSLKDILKDDTWATSLSNFCGPLLYDSRSVSKCKKDVLVYLEERIQEMTNGMGTKESDTILLWKFAKTVLQNDGFIGDREKMDNAILELLRTPRANENQGDFSVPAYTHQQQSVSQLSGGNEDMSEEHLDRLEGFLTQGDRRGAVKYAMDKDMWSHALVISSTVDKSLWQEVVADFAKRELAATPETKQKREYHHVSGNRQALRVLYALFSGAGGGAVSEFLTTIRQPFHQHGTIQQGAPSASCPETTYKELSRWRDTVVLILANRTSNDTEAVAALGDILKNHRRTEAAHICYLMSPQVSPQAGIQDTKTKMTLVGTDNAAASQELDAYFLSEIFEFIQSMNKKNPPQAFLQNYKLAHAWWLADLGMTDKALRYVEAIKTFVDKNAGEGTDINKMYLNQAFQDRLNELRDRCKPLGDKRSPGQSWFKPKSSLLGTLEKFINGEDAVDPTPPRKSTEIMSRPHMVAPMRSASAVDARMGQNAQGGDIRRAATPAAGWMPDFTNTPEMPPIKKPEETSGWGFLSFLSRSSTPISGQGAPSAPSAQTNDFAYGQDENQWISTNSTSPSVPSNSQPTPSMMTQQQPPMQQSYSSQQQSYQPQQQPYQPQQQPYQPQQHSYQPQQQPYSPQQQTYQPQQQAHQPQQQAQQQAYQPEYTSQQPAYQQQQQYPVQQSYQQHQMGQEQQQMPNQTPAPTTQPHSAHQQQQLDPQRSIGTVPLFSPDQNLSVQRPASAPARSKKSVRARYVDVFNK